MIIDIDKTPYININLEPGVYRMQYLQDEVKTILSEIIEAYSEQRIPISKFTYTNYKNKERLESKIRPNTQVFVLWRYDLYNLDSDTEVLSKFIDGGGIVLIDANLAESMPNIPYKFCTVEGDFSGIVIG